jgi:DNA-binding MarR family transcriptional regulator
MTKREVLTKAVAMVDVFSAEEIEVFEKMIKGLDKKSSKPTKNQVANEGLKVDILAILEDGKARTATEIANELGVTVQKASALLRQMVGDTVAKTEAKGKAPATFARA